MRYALLYGVGIGLGIKTNVMRGPLEQTVRQSHQKKSRSEHWPIWVYRDLGVVSSLLVLAPDADELPEPVVCLVALAWCRCLEFAMFFFCLWLATCFFTRVATFHVSSFVTPALGADALAGLPHCANAG